MTEYNVCNCRKHFGSGRVKDCPVHGYRTIPDAKEDLSDHTKEQRTLVFTPAQQRELHYLFGSIPNAGTMALRSPITFEDLCENLRRLSSYLERHGRWDAEDRKELNKLRRQRDAMRGWLGVLND